MFRQSEATGSRIAAGTNTWLEARATKLDQLPSQRITLGGQELPTVRLVVIHIMGDVGDLVLTLGVASQVI